MSHASFYATYRRVSVSHHEVAGEIIAIDELWIATGVEFTAREFNPEVGKETEVTQESKDPIWWALNATGAPGWGGKGNDGVAYDESHGIPQVGFSWPITPNVKVVSRDARLVEKSSPSSDGLVGVPGAPISFTVEVDVHYELQRNKSLPIRGGVSLSSRKTSFWPNTGTPIVTEWGEDDQRGEVEVLSPHANVVISIVNAHQKAGRNLTADEFSYSIVGHVNQTTYMGMGRGKLLCTRCDYSLTEVQTEAEGLKDKFNFEIEFEESLDPIGWVVTANYRTAQGLIPTGAEEKVVTTVGVATPTQTKTDADPPVYKPSSPIFTFCPYSFYDFNGLDKIVTT
jgi:hypothetical protein